MADIHLGSGLKDKVLVYTPKGINSMLTLLYTNRQLIAGRMGVEPIPLLRWF